jgi:hypothetical protein
MKIDDALKDTKIIEQLVENPERADFVKELAISESHAGMAYDYDRKEKRKRVVEDSKGLETAIRNAAKREGRADARVAYLLFFCNNLEVLHTRIGYCILGKLAIRVFEKAASEHLQAKLNPGTTIQQPQLLRSLREFHMTEHIYENGVEEVRTILCLPALHKLRMTGIADTGERSVHSLQPHDGIVRNSNPISLVFDSCMLSGAGIDTLLSTCPNAKELTLCWRPGLWNEHFRNQEACDVLRERGRNLEMVHYDSVSLYEHRYRDSPVGTFGSFAALNAKRLMVPKAFFDHVLDFPTAQRAAEAARLIPKGLKELYVLGVEDDEMAGVQAMVGVDVIPGLEKSVCVPFLHFSLEEYFGTVHHRTVDYDRLGGFHRFELKSKM